MLDDITYYPYDPKTGKSTKPKNPLSYFTEKQISTILTVTCVLLIACLLFGLYTLRQLSLEQAEAAKNKATPQTNSPIKR